MCLQRSTAQQMEDYVDIMELNYQQSDLKDMQPEARVVYERRVEYHKMISNLLESHMIEVAEPEKKAPTQEEDKKEEDKEEDKKEEDKEEDEKQQEEEKKEEKTLYEIPFVYRTVEKRLS